MKTQSKRCIRILLTVILTLQMVFASGIRGFAMETPNVSINPDVEISGLSLVLSGEIGLNFHLKVTRGYRSGVVVLESAGKEPIVENISDCPVKDGCYIITCYLSAIELSTPVTLSVYAAEDIEYENPLAQETQSVENYVALLNQNEKATEAEKLVGRKLISYGHYAQLALSETNGWEIGVDYVETKFYEQLVAESKDFKPYKIKWQKSSETLKRLSMSLKLDYRTGIHLYFPLDEKPTVTVNGEAIEATESERLENNYEVFIDGINALNLGEEYEVTVNTLTFSLSALSYCYLAVTKSARESTVNAIKALFDFYQAIAYYNAVKGE